MPTNLECAICKKTCDSYRKLSKHYRDQHKISTKEYYDTYIKEKSEGLCSLCGGLTTFVSLSEGYKITCSKTECRSNIMSAIREKNKNDIHKNEIFINKVKENQKRIWKERNEDGTSADIRKKIGETLRINNSKMTETERKNKFGWLNSLSESEKQEFIKNVLLNTGCHKWWKNASDDEKHKVIQKRTLKRLNHDKILLDYYNAHKTDLETYYQLVIYFTNITYFKYRNIIDPDHLRGKSHHLDHKYSKLMGFVNNIHPLIISSLYNLEMLPEKDNISKGAKCSIDLDTLLERYKNE